MRIIYFGTDVFLSCFEFFLAHHQIEELYTYHCDEDYMTEEGIVRRAREENIPVTCESITEDRIRSFFQAEGCGLLFAAEYDRKIPVPDNIAGFRGVNVHSSILPDGRSYYPIEAAMERKMAQTGVTMHRLTPVLDCGAILDQRILPITADMDSVDIYLKLGMLARDMTESVMEDFESAWNKAQPQQEKKPYWKRPSPESLTLSHDLTREEALQMFRCFNSLTQVELDGRLHYVLALDTGCASLPRQEWALRKEHWLYSLKNGHARLFVHPKTGSDRR